MSLNGGLSVSIQPSKWLSITITAITVKKKNKDLRPNPNPVRHGVFVGLFFADLGPCFDHGSKPLAFGDAADHVQRSVSRHDAE
jgi:hypothetical protein